MSDKPMQKPAPTLVGGDHLLNLQALALPQNYQDLVQVRKLLTCVPVGKPNGRAFIRVHADQAYSFSTYIMDMKDDGVFIVTPSMQPQLTAECWPAVILTYITRQNDVGLWPIKLAGPDGRLNRWHESALAAANQAKEKWARVQANMALGAYDVMIAEGQLDEPVWPEETFQEIFTIGFKDRIIGSPDHVICQKLSGRI